MSCYQSHYFLYMPFLVTKHCIYNTVFQYTIEKIDTCQVMDEHGSCLQQSQQKSNIILLFKNIYIVFTEKWCIYDHLSVKKLLYILGAQTIFECYTTVYKHIIFVSIFDDIKHFQILTKYLQVVVILKIVLMQTDEHMTIFLNMAGYILLSRIQECRFLLLSS